jgi:lipoprotein signal peptidase
VNRPAWSTTNRRIVLIASAVVALDQTSKATAGLLDHGILAGTIWPIRNSSALLGVVRGTALFLTVLGVVFMVVLCRTAWSKAAEGRLPAWIPALLVGGAIGNQIDRLALGSVRDFLVIPFAIVNLADIAIAVGLCALTILTITGRVDNRPAHDF